MTSAWAVIWLPVWAWLILLGLAVIWWIAMKVKALGEDRTLSSARRSGEMTDVGSVLKAWNVAADPGVLFTLVPLRAENAGQRFKSVIVRGWRDRVELRGRLDFRTIVAIPIERSEMTRVRSRSAVERAISVPNAEDAVVLLFQSEADAKTFDAWFAGGAGGSAQDVAGTD